MTTRRRVATRKSVATRRGGRASASEIDAALLSTRLPLPELDEEGDKDERGRVLVVGGSAQMPGAVVLAGVGALRAGAGKLQLATVRGAALHVAASVPEARVFALAETGAGAVDGRDLTDSGCDPAAARSVLVGPGMLGGDATARTVREVVRLLADASKVGGAKRSGGGRGAEGATLVLDANALNVLADEPDLLKRLRGRVALTPHVTELSEMTSESEEKIARDRMGAAVRAARRFGAVVALKGRETFVASPDGREVYVNRAGNVGLATSGSGDVLAGIVAGLAARGADALTAAVWAVHAHALAGDRLARRVGRVGYLARELPAEIPAVLTTLETG